MGKKLIDKFLLFFLGGHKKIVAVFCSHIFINHHLHHHHHRHRRCRRRVLSSTLLNFVYFYLLFIIFPRSRNNIQLIPFVRREKSHTV